MAGPRITRNAAAAVLQVLVSGLTLFLLYRYLLGSIGIERMGIWSIVLATTSAARLTELGFSGGVVKFVAKFLSYDDFDSAGRAAETAALALALVVGCVLLAAYWPVIWFLAKFLPGSALPEARALVPYALLALWIATIAGIFQSALDGCQRTDLRAAFAIANSILYLVLALLLVPRFGLLGLAYVQVALAIALAVVSWMFLRRQLPGLPLLPSRWSRVHLRSLLGYGLTIQFNTVLMLLADPVTKALLSKFGNLSMVGWYDMAVRMVMQLRALLTAPNQVLVPIFARLHESGSAGVVSMYRDTYQLQAFLALPYYAMVVAVLPSVSSLWIGHLEHSFVLFSILLVVGWSLNGFVNPAYFANLGTGRMRWNTVAHVVIGLLNCLLGAIAGLWLGGVAVVVAWVVALVIGSSVVVLAFHRENRMPLRELVPAGSGWLLVACCIGVALAWFSYFRLTTDLHAIVRLVVGATACAAVALPAMWLHPMRGRVLRLLRIRAAD